MRAFCLSAAALAVPVWLFPPALSAQNGSASATTYTYDVNGRRVADSAIQAVETGNLRYRAQILEDVNGRRRPTEEVTERIVSQGAGAQVVERTIRRYDQNGNPAPPEKQVIEVRHAPDGSSVTVTAVYRGDLNGRLTLAERSVTEVRWNGERFSAATRLERPTLNGAMEVVEKKTATGAESEKRKETDTITLRRDVSGRFVPAFREVSRSESENGVLRQDVAEYDATGSQMRLVRRREIEVREGPGGSRTRTENIYEAALPGQAQNPSGGLGLREQQVVEVRRQGDATVEVFKVRRPAPDNPRLLGAFRVVSETVCTGACENRATIPPVQSAAQQAAQAGQTGKGK